MIGEQISHFYVIRQLGSGGMGVVYEAQDTRLPRSVAIKVLRPNLSHDGTALRRFKREARLASSLNHPNICTIFDVEEANGQSFIAMELLHGRSLKSRLVDGPLPLDAIVDIAVQVSDALAAAHDQGIVHRDIAPGNVFLTENGLVKLLDFGLAKHFSTADEQGEITDEQNETTDELTATGAIAGTLPYMSPERFTPDASADRRSDLYSLGILLYQMSAGARPFDKVPRTELAAAIQSAPHVPLRQIVPDVPPELERIIDKLLAKRREDRYQSARELRTALAALREGEAVSTSRIISMAAADASITAPRSRDHVRLLLAAIALVAVASAAWIASNKVDQPVSRFVARNLIGSLMGGTVSITPDGQTLVYVDADNGGTPITLLPLDQRPKRVLAGTLGARSPVVSPDGREVAFISGGKFKVVAIESGPATHAGNGWRYGNPAWLSDGRIVTDVGWNLMRSEHGTDSLSGLTQLDTSRGETRHLGPLLLPGRHVVFTVSNRIGPGVVTGRLALASIDPRSASVSTHVLLDATARQAIAFVDGWLLYISADGKSIVAQQLDLKQQRVVGAPVTVLEDEEGNVEKGSLADNGTLFYVRRPSVNSVVLLDGNGSVLQGFPSPDGPFMNPRFSPDGKRFVVQAATRSGHDAWVYDLASRTPTRLTTTGHAIQPSWTPDGRRVVFMRERLRGLMWQSVEGSEQSDTIPGTSGAFAPTVMPDGNGVVFQTNPDGGSIWSTLLDKTGAPQKLVADTFVNRMPAVSPNGHLLAYASNATGRSEVYVRPLSKAGPIVQVSDSGATEPGWSPDGRRIYYRANGALIAAEVTTPALRIISRKQQFKDDFAEMPHRNYDVSPDGKSFLMITTGAPEAVVVLNWVTQLRKQLAREH